MRHRRPIPPVIAERARARPGTTEQGCLRSLVGRSFSRFCLVFARTSLSAQEVSTLRGIISSLTRVHELRKLKRSDGNES